METTLGFRKCACLVFLLLLFSFRATKAADVTSTLMIGGSRIDVTIDTAEAPLSQPDVMKWVQSAAESVAAYYGRFPVPHLTLRIVSFDGNGVRHGTTWGKDGGLIVIHAGSKTTPADFAEDWMLTHEMIHLAFPSMADQHHWIEEGISVYVEPIARVQAEQLSAERMWSDVVRDMPQGEPGDGDRGLDNTHTWGRTYWGGAMFCLVADVRIRQQTSNRKGLQDALRGILAAGGNITEDWEIERALGVGDKATGTTVLVDLYHAMREKPDPVDFPAMWKQLGIHRAQDGSVQFDASAPLADVRTAITRREATKPSGQP